VEAAGERTETFQKRRNQTDATAMITEASIKITTREEGASNSTMFI
jgi:hypothetical protein